MEDLYICTENGKSKISNDIVEKYGLNQGTLSPFTKNRIVGKDGEFYLEQSTEEDLKKDFYDMAMKGFESDGIDQMENGFELSQSEILDFAQGTDSGD